MSVRASFVEHFGEITATKVEEAALMHQNDSGQVHAEDQWGDDPFQYHLLVCISWECLTRFKAEHGIEPDSEELRAWVLEYGNLHKFSGDIPDYIGFLAGAYYPWINWERAGVEPPESWTSADERRKDRKPWSEMTPEEKGAEMSELAAEGLRLMNERRERGE